MGIAVVRLPAPETDNVLLDALLYGGGADGAREVLSVIAGSLITVTGVVFSVTIVALQLASSQFTPRVLRGFVGDRVNQVVLAVFIGTFTYTLVVLRTVRSSLEDQDSFVPELGVTLGIILLLASVAALIVFIDHLARSIQVATILERETRRTLAHVEALYPEAPDRGEDKADAGQSVVSDAGPDHVVVPAGQYGHLQAVQSEALFKACEKRGVSIRMELRVGDFAFAGMPLVTLWPASAVDQRLRDAIQDAFLFGIERTLEQDVEFGITKLSDIAVRALSPGINDPTTAVHCIDRLTQVLAAIGLRDNPPRVRTSEDGSVRMYYRNPEFEDAVVRAYDQIRHSGGDNPMVAAKLLSAIAALLRLLPARRHPPLRAAADAVLRHARATIRETRDLAMVEGAAAGAMND